MSSPFSHLYAIRDRIDREKDRKASAEACLPNAGKRQRAILENEIAFRTREIASAMREHAAEIKFLEAQGHDVFVATNLSDDELLKELGV